MHRAVENVELLVIVAIFAEWGWTVNVFDGAEAPEA